MKKSIKITIAIIILIVLTFFIVKKSIKIYNNFQKVNMPTNQSRELSSLGVYNYIKVEEFIENQKISQKSFFEALEISPVPEDNQLTLKELRKKYNKSPNEFKEILKIFILEKSDDYD